MPILHFMQELAINRMNKYYENGRDLIECVMSLSLLKGLPHCNVENGELGVGDLVDELSHHVEGSFLSFEGKLAAGKGSQATEGQ